MDADESSPGKIVWLHIFRHDFLYLGPEAAESLLESFVAALQVMDLVDLGSSAGDQAGKDQAGAGAQIRGLDGRAAQAPNACDDCRWTFLSYVSSHSQEFLEMHEAVWINPFSDHADTLDKTQKGHHLGLKVGGETGVGKSGDIDGLEGPISIHPHAIVFR